MDNRSVSAALWGVLRHPVTELVHNWNWKSAILSSGCRALIFFAANAPAGVGAGVRAMLTELLFRACASGLLGSLTQTLRSAQPAWAAAVAALLIMPAAGHLAEYAVHAAAGTPRLAASLSASIGFTCLTTLFNLFAMRRGVLIVGAGQRPLREDLRLLPRLFAAFVIAGCESIVAAAGSVAGREPCSHEDTPPDQRLSRDLRRDPDHLPRAPAAGRTGVETAGARRARRTRFG